MKYTEKELQEILLKHEKWLKNEQEGIRADLSDTNLRNADLRYADLRNVDLRNADLSDTNLRNADNEFSLCPEVGSFIGFKKCRDNKMVKILITEDSKRSSATSRKCRASKVRVLDIYDVKNKNIRYLHATSHHDSNFIYTLGNVIEIDDFDDNRWNECSTGIHFFLTEDEARRYKK